MKELGPFWRDSLEIKINASSQLPAWVQIGSIIAGQVMRRRIKVGEFIWSIRDVALHNHLNTRTVAKAYNVLREKSMIESIPKKGFRVGKRIIEHKDQLFEAQLMNLVIMARQMEMDKIDLVKAISKVWS